MSATSEVSRREFLKTGALVGGSLVLSVWLPSETTLTAAEALAAGARFEPNAWLKIDPEGTVTVMVARSELGQGARTALPMLVAEELEADWSKVRWEQAIPGPAYGDMSTGGSRSIRSLWTPLRTAGAAAREMLITAAADTWGVDRASCRAEAGAVIHAATGRRVEYGDLLERAARIPVPENPPLKDPKNFRILGTRIKRLDAAAKADGSAVFGLDVRVPGMLTAVVVRCPVFGGTVSSLDDSAALQVRGVKRVERIGSGVAVVADSYWAARKGAEALQIRWDEGPLAGLDSASIHRKWEELITQAGATGEHKGDGDAAIDKAARKLEAIYEVPYLAHATLEPMNCTAHVQGDRCEIWIPTQVASNAQDLAARTTGLKPEAVVVHTTFSGGGFGRRAELDHLTEALEISKSVGAPVKVVWSREDDMQHDFYRPATYNLLRAGLDAQGSLVGWFHRIVGPSILARWGEENLRQGIDPTSLEGAWHLPYAIPNVRVEYVRHEPGVPIGWWRSVGASQNAYISECFMDEVAVAAGRDPFEYKRDLLKDAPRHRAVLELAARKAGWGTPLPRGRGRGIAMHESFGSFVAMVVEVTVDGQGTVKVDRVVCAVDCGVVVNPDTIEAQMEGGIVFGLTAALKGEITIERGRVRQANYDDYPLLTLRESPAIEVHLAPGGDPVGGIGEPGVPPVAPALANAIFAATGKRARRLPVRPADLVGG